MIAFSLLVTKEYWHIWLKTEEHSVDFISSIKSSTKLWTIMRSLSIFFILSIFILNVASQIPINGTCPDICNVNHTSLNINDFLGIWYLQKYASSFFDKTMKCGYWNVTHVEGQTVVGNFQFRSVLWVLNKFQVLLSTTDILKSETTHKNQFQSILSSSQMDRQIWC